MREEVRALTSVLLSGIAQDEALADKLDRMAGKFDPLENTQFCNAFRSISRMHRVKAIENRARLAALVDRYAHLFTN